MLKNRTLQIIILGVVIGLTAVGLTWYWHYTAQHPSTDDAYIQAHTIEINARVTGEVSKVYINDHQLVKKGQPLFDVDPQPFIVALNKAKANLKDTQQQVAAAQSTVASAEAELKEKQAQLVRTQKDTKRTLSLAKSNFVSKSDADQARQDLTVAENAVNSAQSQVDEAKAKLGDLGNQNASIQAAKAEVNQASLNLSYTKVVAPATGHVENFTLRVGDGVNAYQGLFSIVENHQFWAAANFKETQLDRIHGGEPAIIKVDMYPHHIFHGIVSRLSAGSGSSFSLLPAENATGNWVKVTQRFPVRVDIISTFPDAPLRLGASCTVTINTTAHAQHR